MTASLKPLSMPLEAFLSHRYILKFVARPFLKKFPKFSQTKLHDKIKENIFSKMFLNFFLQNNTAGGFSFSLFLSTSSPSWGD
jgi:hypothetical protein